MKLVKLFVTIYNIVLVIIASQLAERSIKMDSEYLEDICKRADYYGMESLTEEEQCILEKVFGTMVIDTINKYPDPLVD